MNALLRYLTLLALPLALLSLSARPALGVDAEPADTSSAADLFKAGTEALSAGHPADAIADFEALGDHGVVDPVVSFDRGLAYASRVREGGQVEGDLGRAVHGFEEAASLTRDPSLKAEAERALVDVRAEIAHRRAQAGDPIEFEHGTSLGRAIASILPENVWAFAALACSVVLALGLVVRTRQSSPRAKVAIQTRCAVAGLLLAACLTIALVVRNFRRNVREGIVVTDNVTVLDDRHVKKAGTSPIPEGTRVRLLGDDGEFTRMSFGPSSGFIPTSSVLPLAKP